MSIDQWLEPVALLGGGALCLWDQLFGTYAHPEPSSHAKPATPKANGAGQLHRLGRTFAEESTQRTGL